MRVREISVQQIIVFLGTSIKKIYGNTERIIDNLSDVSHANASTLDWVNAKSNNDQQVLAEKSPAKVLLVGSSVAYSDLLKKQGKTLIVVDDPKKELAKIGNAYFADKNTEVIHPTSIVDPQSEISEGVSVGPFSYIGKAQIGRASIIGANVRIYDDVQIGECCTVKDGAVIGGEGFGYERDEDGNLLRFPQIGDVIIGNNVDIGANTCIDRGALSTTYIGDYTKINNLCHIAHNNTIGKNVVIAAEVNISGGNVIEDDCWIGPSSSIRGYIHIGKGCTIGTGAIVVKDVPCGEVWVGNPAKRLR